MSIVRLERAKVNSIVLATVAFLVAGACFAQSDGVTLTVERGPVEGEYLLTWTGGQPLFEIFGKDLPQELVNPANKLGETSGRIWDIKIPPGEVFFFRITSPCVVDPPERCDGIDNDCDGTIDGPGSESYCELANATPVCTAGNCAIDSCDPGFDDCDGAAVTGCESDLDSDIDNCGVCGNPCDLANATPVCDLGECDIDFCSPGFEDCDVQIANGCEIDTDGDAANCGACGSPCDLANASASCVSGACTIAGCDVDFSDCDGDAVNGCEIDLNGDAVNCGSCGFVCNVPNATASCAGGLCAVSNCNPNFWDLNADAADGCEYACTFQSSVDFPDDAFVDANCDGIDGDTSSAIFVAIEGSDSWPGTRGQPKRTVLNAINAAYAQGKDVYVSAGTYYESPVLQSGVSVYGGYSRAANWSRSTGYVSLIQGGTTAMTCTGAAAVILDHLTIRASNASALHGSSYVLRLSSCDSITVRRSRLEAGSGGGGTHGSSGASALAGDQGGNGQIGCEDSSFACATCSRPVGGGGGSGCGGNVGGQGGYPGQATSNGSAGSSGAGPGGSGGAGGNCDRDSNGNCGTYGACYNGASGQNGLAGSAGVNGSGGSAFTSYSSATYSVSNGSQGTSGTRGGGGGGGGGGHGGDDGCNSYGSAGGGGGGGGCGGNPGGLGTGGGGSFGIWVYQGSGILIEATDIVTSNGGAGGNGGPASNGGAGGNGGSGWFYGGSGEQDDGGCGGTGGNGGSGGRGGHGGGGGGGPSVGIVFRQCNTCSQTANSFVLGNGGTGGFSSGNSGATGLRTSVHTF